MPDRRIVLLNMNPFVITVILITQYFTSVKKCGIHKTKPVFIDRICKKLRLQSVQMNKENLHTTAVAKVQTADIACPIFNWQFHSLQLSLMHIVLMGEKN